MLTVQKWIVPILFMVLIHQASGQVTAVPIGELTDSVRLQPKPSLILISTSWCSYCQMQKAQLKKNADFQAASAHFYFSEFDAETKETISFNGSTYGFQSTGVDIGTHELAYVLGNIKKRLTFPTWVLIDENFTVLFKYPGVLDKKALREIVTYLSDKPLPNKAVNFTIK